MHIRANPVALQVSTNSTAGGGSAVSDIIVTPPTSDPSTAVTQDSQSLPPNVRTIVVAVMVIVVSLIILAATMFLWFNRRRRLNGDAQNRTSRITRQSILDPILFRRGAAVPPKMNQQEEVQVDPIILRLQPAALPRPRRMSHAAITVRQKNLEDELRDVQQKIVDIQDLERRALTEAAAPRRILRFISPRSISLGRGGSSRSPDLESQLEAARERNGVLAGRIRDLEAQMQSSNLRIPSSENYNQIDMSPIL
ncbi:hypothetical protein C8R43DRAFT_984988 [Mycena crocata]|nr:hypothetical protein C8R43DRAFT_984988 [Mycena crocata]